MSRETGEERTSVYLIQAGANGPYKIGQAADPAKRLRELQVGNPEKLHLRVYISGVSKKLERQLHSQLAEFRIRGEWYKNCVEVERAFYKLDKPAVFIYMRLPQQPRPGIPNINESIDTIIEIDGVPIGSRVSEFVFESMNSRIEDLGISESKYIRDLVTSDLDSIDETGT